jgi:uncharacterized protein (TIGR02757 family)
MNSVNKNRIRLKEALEAHYLQFHHREWVDPDPILFLYRYSKPADREIVGLLASTLAYGQVSQILKSVAWVLHRMGPSPLHYLIKSDDQQLAEVFSSFKHRWTTGHDLVELFSAARQTILEYGSLEGGFAQNPIASRESLLEAMDRFGARFGGLVACPCDGSACKRFNLFLRWMVRCDEIDPGGWTRIAPRALIVPVDVHMHRIARQLRFTERKTADLRTALEITQAFSEISPEDPVRYDFSLTRFGIHPKLAKTALSIA